MKKLNEDFISDLKQSLLEEHTDIHPDQMDAFVTDFITESSTEAAESMTTIIKEESLSELEKSREKRLAFEARLWNRWKKPLELLEMLVRIASEVGDEFNRDFREEAKASTDLVFKSLTMIHARACQTSSAILALLRSGHADDAHARWRSLHEMAVIAFFIASKGQDIAERYLLHDVIQRYKLALKDRDNSEIPVLTEEEFEILECERNSLVRRFGKQFKRDYGWASSAFDGKRVNFDDIERHVELNRMRPFYGMANDNVHVNSHGMYYRLGLCVSPGEALLAGPSNAGLADPGHGTAISLFQITIALLQIKPGFSTIVFSKVGSAFVKEIGDAFLEVHEEMVKESKRLPIEV